MGKYQWILVRKEKLKTRVVKVPLGTPWAGFLEERLRFQAVWGKGLEGWGHIPALQLSLSGEALEEGRLSPTIAGLGGGVSKIETGLQTETLSQKLNNVRR